MKRTAWNLAVATAVAALGGCGGSSSARHDADVEAIKKEVTPATKFSMDSEGKDVTGDSLGAPATSPEKK